MQYVTGHALNTSLSISPDQVFYRIYALLVSSLILFFQLCSAAMAGLSSYAIRMARLSAQIFGEVVRPTDSKSMKVVRLFQEPPMAQKKEVYDWYPQHKIYYSMTQKLRFMGLFRY